MEIHVRIPGISGKCLCLPLIVAGFQILALRIAFTYWIRQNTSATYKDC